MQQWLTNRISFESYSARKSWGVGLTPPAHEGLNFDFGLQKNHPFLVNPNSSLEI